MSCWQNFSPGDDAPDWLRNRRRELQSRTFDLADKFGGCHLTNLDIRADNLLFDPSGQAWVLDWSHASVGANWVAALLLLDVIHDFPHLSDHVVDLIVSEFVVDPQILIDFQIGLLGYHLYISQ